MLALGLGVLFLAIISLIALARSMRRAGRDSERQQAQRHELERIDQADEVRRTVMREPDPRELLKRKWSRRVLPDSRPDSD